MNHIVISGNVGNAELKQIGTNTLLTFSLAVKKKFCKDKDNDTEWFKCNLWGSRATSLQQYIVKGAGLVVGGEMQMNYNPDKKQSFPQVNVDNVDIMKWAEQSQGNQQSTQQPRQQPQQPQQQQYQPEPQQQQNNHSYQNNRGGFQAIDNDDDIPFK